MVQKIINPQKKKYWKFWLVMTVLNIGLLFVVYKLFSIQVIHGNDYREQARRQHEAKVNLSAERGNIYDRNGKLLASTVQSASIAIDPNVITRKEKVLQLIEKLFNIPKNKLLNKIGNSSGSFVWLVRGVDYSRTQELRDLKEKGLIIVREPRRIYHYGSIGSQIIGLTDIDNDGLSGIELKWDSLLKGKSGYMVMNRDGLGKLRPAADLPLFEAQNGLSLKLTINIELQRIIEHELKQGVINAAAETGTLVAIEPKTGEILAMASYPGYDPVDFTRHSAGAMRNRAITDVYEPGSTFKIITSSAALEEKIVSENDIYNGHLGVLEFGSYTIRDVHPYGMITFRHAMEVSSNIILSQVASKIPDNLFYKYIRDFGFGLESGVELPGEVGGKLRKPKDINSTIKRYMGFGYGISVTALQLANAYSTIANDGVMMKPYIVKSVFNNLGEESVSHKPEAIRRVISKQTSDRMKSILEGIVNVGTGKGAIINGMRVAGKTGTSQQLVGGQYSKENYYASFAGFFPAECPKIAMLIVIDRPRAGIYGGTMAAPIFRNIATRWMAIDKSLFEPNNATKDTIKPKLPDSTIVPSLVGLPILKAKEIAKNYGLLIDDNGRIGLVKYQDQFAYTKVKFGLKLNVTTNEKLPERIVVDSLPNLKGMTLRNALSIVNRLGCKVTINGSGNVYDYSFVRNGSKVSKCTLNCKN